MTNRYFPEVKAVHDNVRTKVTCESCKFSWFIDNKFREEIREDEELIKTAKELGQLMVISNSYPCTSDDNLTLLEQAEVPGQPRCEVYQQVSKELFENLNVASGLEMHCVRCNDFARI
ncbi:TPA_asm: Oncoid2 [Manila clam xenomavirus]|nr:TPA_asm: Oncoid2 [Manila clam xenomavirus]